MRHHRLITAWWIALVVTLCSVSSVGAFPPLPSSFYGTVQQDDENIPDGTLVEALVDGYVMAYSLSETYQGISVYSLDIPGDDSTTIEIEGGTAGQTIEFRVGGVLADQTAKWTSGVNQNLDLELPKGKVLSPTLPTYTPVPTQTPIPTATTMPTVIQTTGNNLSNEAPTSETNIEDTPLTSLTLTETQTNQGSQLESEPAIGETSNSSQKGTPMAVLSSEDGEPISDPLVANGNDTRNESIKPNPVFWIGLTILLLVSALGSVIALRKKHGNLDSLL